MKSNDHMGPIRPMNFAAFDLNLLRVFDAVMRERSVTRAGEQIGLSQPAVSAALQRLRDLLDDKLFARNGNDMVPTPRAESIAAGVGKALAGLERLLAAERGFDPTRLTRTFTLMGADFFTTLFVPRLMQDMTRFSNGISIRFLESAAGQVERLLRDDAIDMALERAVEVADTVVHERLFLAPFKIVIAADHPAIADLPDGSALTLDQFCSLDWAIRSIDGSLSGWTDQALEKLGRSRRVVLAVPHFHAVTSSVRLCGLAAAIPAQYAAVPAMVAGLRVFEPPFSAPAPDVRLYWHSRRSRDPAHEWMRGRVRALCGPYQVG